MGDTYEIDYLGHLLIYKGKDEVAHFSQFIGWYLGGEFA